MIFTKEESIKLFELIIESNGRPSTNTLIDALGKIKGNEASRQLNIANLAVYTDSQLVKMAKACLEAFQK